MIDRAKLRAEFNAHNCCDRCHGSGHVVGADLIRRSCPRCGGDGVLATLPSGPQNHGRVVRSTRGLS